MGYHQAFPHAEIVGVDIEAQPDYPFAFERADAVEYAATVSLDFFDLVHASPPCQRYSKSRHSDEHPELIAPIRELIQHRPAVIENVPQAPIRRDLFLCGSMFGLPIMRHRSFELLNLPLVLQPSCRHVWPEGRAHTITGNASGANYHHAHHLGFRDREHAGEIMQMPWVTKLAGITEAIPPAYTRFIGESIADALDTTAGDSHNSRQEDGTTT